MSELIPQLENLAPQDMVWIHVPTPAAFAPSGARTNLKNPQQSNPSKPSHALP